jgi:uncharacterized membrane protein
MKRFWHLFSLFCIALFVFIRAQPTQAQTPIPGAVVRAVLFYSPTCPHCQYVITQVLPLLFEKYGEQLQMVGIDVTQPGGQVLYTAAMDKYGYDLGGVPFLAIGDYYLVGSVDIPGKFPGLIEQYLAQGGVDWPAIPGLAEVLAASQTVESPAASPTVPAPAPQPTSLAASPTATLLAEKPAPTATPGLLLNNPESSSLGGKLALDPLGNAFAIVVLIGMVLSVVIATLFFWWIPGWWISHAWSWMIPILCLIGLGVAGYLTHVETTQVQAVCGPVGDCNTVQQSEYARLFGILPIGILGLAGYGTILIAWVVGRFTSSHLAAYACLALLGMTAFGLLFSIYLTFLEPFVIGATCAWCLTSAILMTALFWLSLASGRQALFSLLDRE